MGYGSLTSPSMMNRSNWGGSFGGGMRTQAPYQTPQSVYGLLGRDHAGYGMPQNYGMNPYQSFSPRYNPYAGGMSGKGGQMGGNYMGGMGYRPQPNFYLSPFGGPFPLNQFHSYNPYAGTNFYSNLMGYGNSDVGGMVDPTLEGGDAGGGDVADIGTYPVGASRSEILNWANQNNLIGGDSIIDQSEYDYLQTLFSNDQQGKNFYFGSPQYEFQSDLYPNNPTARSTFNEFNQLIDPYRQQQDQGAFDSWWKENIYQPDNADNSVNRSAANRASANSTGVLQTPSVADWQSQYRQNINPYALGKGGGWY